MENNKSIVIIGDIDEYIRDHPNSSGHTSVMQTYGNPEFGEIRTLVLDGEPWMVGKDVAAALGYSNTRDALARHVDDEDKGVVKCDTPGGTQDLTIINESGLYSLVLSSKLPGAKKFRRWVTSEVLPSIRINGGYNLPKDFPSALRALADTEERRAALAAENRTLLSKNNALAEENEHQRQAIADFQPIKQYVDQILSSDGTMTTTQIAADYDMTAYQLNKVLSEERIQHKVNGQWILYRRHMGRGYTRSETISIVRSDGRADTKLNTVWTQKGRLLIHEILTKHGIKAVMDREAA